MKKIIVSSVILLLTGVLVILGINQSKVVKKKTSQEHFI